MTLLILRINMMHKCSKKSHDICLNELMMITSLLTNLASQWKKCSLQYGRGQRTDLKSLLLSRLAEMRFYVCFYL